MAYMTQWQTHAVQHQARPALQPSVRDWEIQTKLQGKQRLLLTDKAGPTSGCAQAACAALIEAAQRTVKDVAGGAVTCTASTSAGLAPSACVGVDAVAAAAVLSGAACSIAMEEAGLRFQMAEHSSFEPRSAAAAADQSAGDCHGSRTAAGQVLTPRCATPGIVADGSCLVLQIVISASAICELPFGRSGLHTAGSATQCRACWYLQAAEAEADTVNTPTAAAASTLPDNRRPGLPGPAHDAVAGSSGRSSPGCQRSSGCTRQARAAAPATQLCPARAAQQQGSTRGSCGSAARQRGAARPPVRAHHAGGYSKC